MVTTMQTYTVSWEMQIEAEHALEAAQIAHEIILEPNEYPSDFQVLSSDALYGDGDPVYIELATLDG